MRRLTSRGVVCLSFMALLFTGVSQSENARAAYHFLAVSGDSIVQFSPEGTWIRRITVPYPSNRSAQFVRDVVVAPDGRLYVYNGSAPAFLSIYDPVHFTWTHHHHPGLSSANVGGYGGIAIFQNFVYLSDALMYDGSGIVRFNLNDFSSQRFGEGPEYIDLTIGQDGLLYALAPGGSPDGTHAFVYDPLSLELLRTIQLGGTNGNRGIAVNAAGEIFTCNYFDGGIHRFDPNGVWLNSVGTGVIGLQDLDLSPDGKLVAGNRDGFVTVTDVNFSSVDTFTLDQGSNVFVAFFPITDTQSPILSNPQITPTKLPAKGGNIAFRVTATDNAGVASAWVEITGTGGKGIYYLSSTSGDATNGT